MCRERSGSGGATHGPAEGVRYQTGQGAFRMLVSMSRNSRGKVITRPGRGSGHRAGDRGQGSTRILTLSPWTDCATGTHPVVSLQPAILRKFTHYVHCEGVRLKEMLSITAECIWKVSWEVRGSALITGTHGHLRNPGD